MVQFKFIAILLSLSLFLPEAFASRVRVTRPSNVKTAIEGLQQIPTGNLPPTLRSFIANVSEKDYQDPAKAQVLLDYAHSISIITASTTPIEGLTTEERLEALGQSLEATLGTTDKKTHAIANNIRIHVTEGENSALLSEENKLTPSQLKRLAAALKYHADLVKTGVDENDALANTNHGIKDDQGQPLSLAKFIENSDICGVFSGAKNR